MPTLKQLNISHTGMAFDPQTGDSLQLNESAKLILTLLHQGQSSEEISQRISAVFGIPYDQGLTDVLEFQVHLQILGLMT